MVVSMLILCFVATVTANCPPCEVWDNCDVPNCRPRTCAEVDSPVPCLADAFYFVHCTKGCRCIDGQVRDKTGKCIPVNECPKTCKDPNAVYKNCTSACPPTCACPEPKACNLKCKAGCECLPNYILDRNGNCIKHSECSKTNENSCCGDANAVFTECRDSCRKSCDPSDVATSDKPLCPACACKKGFIYCNRTGRCIEESCCREECLCEKKPWKLLSLL